MSDDTTSHDALPALPPTWENEGHRLFRFTSPNGKAVAWLCPEIGGDTIAYAVKVGEEWVHILAIGTPAEVSDAPSRYGLPLLFPFPGHMRNRRYQWNGQTIEVPPTVPGIDAVTHGFAHVRPWRLTRHADNGASAEFRTPDDIDAEQAASYPFTVRLTQDLDLSEEGDLLVRLTAVNEGAEPAPVAFGLHPYFGEGVLGPDRTQVHVDLPGASARVRTGERAPYMTGEREPAPPNPVSIVAMGETIATGRTDFKEGGDTAVIRDLRPIDGRSGWTVDVFMNGFSDLLFFAPPWQNSISIEPQSHMPGCASLPEGHPDGLVALAPGATLEAVCRIRLVPPAS